MLILPAMIGGAALLADASSPPPSRSPQPSRVCAPSNGPCAAGRRADQRHHHHHHHYLRPICHAARRHLVNRQAVRPAHDAVVPVPGRRRSVQHARQPVHLARAQPHPRHYVPVLAHQPFGHYGARLCLPVDNRCEALYSDMGHVGKANIYASWPFVKAALSSTIWVRELGYSPITPTPRCSRWISSTRSI